ncbi:MAG TPA: BON domain-containing protein [Flavisolibacter sp.]
MQAFQISRLLFGLVILLGVSAASCKDKNRDSEIQSAFNTKAQSDPSLAGVSISVVDGTATLTGTCADENCRTNAEKAVDDIDGVKKVVNNITVAPVVITDDAPLRTSAQQVAGKYNVQADVNNGVITLRGTIDDRDKLQQLMSEMQALRPKRVENQLVIKNN